MDSKFLKIIRAMSILTTSIEELTNEVETSRSESKFWHDEYMKLKEAREDISADTFKNPESDIETRRR